PNTSTQRSKILTLKTAESRLRTTTPEAKAQTKVGITKLESLKCSAIKLDKYEALAKHTAKRAKVSMAESAVIKRLCCGCSKVIRGPASAAWTAFSVPAGTFTFFISRRATGPPIKPPQTKPKVAQAIPKATAPSMPKSVSKICPQPAAVPCPPTKVIE